ncbi:MAG: precorrin-2 C(20)-methyltransferase [Clostridia bacterium]|nr:precorrin-2 C(20)-methyltransferase [Clostridia bacterium]
MSGKMYGVGIGPGDPELLTLKAKRILEQVDCIAIPKTSGDRKSHALSIVSRVMDVKKDIIELVFPMSFDGEILGKGWKDAVGEVRQRLEQGKDIAFITLGDPTVYSTYFYIHKELKSMGYETEIVPGVTSFCAAAAKAGVSLGENRESIAVIPSAYECENLDEVLDGFDTIVLMKVAKNIDMLRKKLMEKGLVDKAVIVSKCGFEDELIEFNLNKVEDEKLSYFSTIIVRKAWSGIL